MTDSKNNWERMAFKGNKVWLEVDDQKRPLVKNNKVRIKYQLNQDYEYMVHPDSVHPLNQLEKQKQSKNTAKKSAKTPGKKNGSKAGEDDRAVIDMVKKQLSGEAILIFTDGACSGNPGPAGIGVLMLYKENEKSISTYLGEATNNIAELKAIQAGLKEVKNKKMPVRVFTDSAYSAGVLAQGWKAQKNQELIGAIKKIMAQFSDLQLIKVKGHAGVWENEKADELATSAIKKAVDGM